VLATRSVSWATIAVKVSEKSAPCWIRPVVAYCACCVFKEVDFISGRANDLSSIFYAAGPRENELVRRAMNIERQLFLSFLETVVWTVYAAGTPRCILR